MEDDHRQLIKDNIDKLVAKTQLKRLMELCVQNKLISVIMQDNLNKEFADPQERHRQLFIKLTKRGPKAYSKLLEILQKEFPPAEKVLNSEFTSIHEKKIIEGYGSIDSNDRTAPPITEPDQSPKKSDKYNVFEYDDSDEIMKLEIYSKPTDHDPSMIVEKSQKIHYDHRIGTYSMSGKYRGVFLMVNIITFPVAERRNGAEIDRENLIHLFRQLGYDVFYYENLRLNQFQNVVKQLLRSDYTKRAESFVMALLTHGDMVSGKEIVEFHDGAVIYLTEIVQEFSNTNCVNLLGKPKIFIFPFCRGRISDKGTYGGFNRVNVQTDGFSETINNPTLSDIIIFYASVPGFKTHRDPKEGSWYVQIMCKVWAKHAHDTDVETLEKKVGEETGKIRSEYRLQTSSRVTYGFNKTLYFNPGCYLDAAK